MTFQLRLTLFCIGLLFLAGCITIATPIGVVQVDYAPDWVLPTLDPTPTIEVFPTSIPMETGRVTTLKLNVRTSPGTNHPINLQHPYLLQGTEVEILQRSQVGDVIWFQVALPPDSAPIGWVSSQFVEVNRG